MDPYYFSSMVFIKNVTIESSCGAEPPERFSWTKPLYTVPPSGIYLCPGVKEDYRWDKGRGQASIAAIRRGRRDQKKDRKNTNGYKTPETADGSGFCTANAAKREFLHHDSVLRPASGLSPIAHRLSPVACAPPPSAFLISHPVPRRLRVTGRESPVTVAVY